MRSLLVMSPDLAHCPKGEADGMVLDLTAASTDTRNGFRDRTAGFAAAGRDGAPKLYMRVHALGTGLVDDDLDLVMPARPDAILLDDTRGRADLARLGSMLAVREAELGIADGATRVVAMACSAQGVLGISTIPGASPRLVGLGWDARALGNDLGCRPADGGPWPDPVRTARAMVLIAAAAGKLRAIDTPHVGAEPESLAEACRQARRDGFGAKLALDPAQLPVINAIFGTSG